MTWHPHMKETKEPVWQELLREAYLFADRYSFDRETKVGALLLENAPGGLRLIGKGANILKREVELVFEEDYRSALSNLTDKAWKYDKMEHAEAVAIRTATEMGYDVRGATMVMPWIPCGPCSEKMMEAGLARLVSHKQMVLQTPERWHESTNKGLDDLQKSGVECLMYDGPIDKVFGTFSRGVWLP